MPSRQALCEWLDSDAVVMADGGVLSWVSPSGTGFPYPEAAAIWLAWAAWRRDRGEPGPSLSRVEPVAGRLLAELQAGPLGKDGHGYLFDTCLAFAALARWTGGSAGGPIVASTSLLDAGLRALEPFIDGSDPVVPGSSHTARWSSRWGPFLERAAAFLDQASLDLGVSGVADIAREVRSRILPVNGEAGYLHAMAYALEGLAMSGSSALNPEAVADLAAWQRSGGDLPAWAGGTGPGRSDATAQAVRLWCRFRFPGRQKALEKGLAALARFQTPSGGLVYEESGDDINTWATAFADQATAWANDSAAGVETSGEPWI
jgi:hypothetical protein